MASKAKRSRLSAAAVTAARPKAREYMLWDGVLSSFGLRMHPSGAKSFVVQTRVRGRMRKFTLGRFPDMGIMDARKEAAAVLARIWAGEDPAPPQRPKAPVFREFAAHYRENRKGVWKPASLKTFDIYMRGRLLPAFGRLKLDTIDHARVSAWFDAASVDRPGSANRAFDILSAMLKTARKWGELGEHVPDACANIVRNPKKVVARYLDEDELAWLGAVLDRHADEHRWPVAALRLLSLTGARLSEVLNLRWDEIGVLSEDGASARIDDSKTGPRTLRFGPEAAKLVSALPRTDGAERVFPEDLTSHRLYMFLHVLVRRPRGSRIARPAYPRLPAYMGLAERQERRGPPHRRQVAWTQAACYDHDLRSP